MAVEREKRLKDEETLRYSDFQTFHTKTKMTSDFQTFRPSDPHTPWQWKPAIFIRSGGSNQQINKEQINPSTEQLIRWFVDSFRLTQPWSNQQFSNQQINPEQINKEQINKSTPQQINPEQINKSTNQPLNKSTNQRINKSTNQRINKKNNYISKTHYICCKIEIKYHELFCV
jgi:hypothetical protein